jgi:hypothetical protein
MPINSRGLVEDGLLNANAFLFSVCILYLDKPSCFLFIRSESAEDTGGSCSVAVKVVWRRGSGVGKLI